MVGVSRNTRGYAHESVADFSASGPTALSRAQPRVKTRPTPRAPRLRTADFRLEPRGWNPATRQRLETLIRVGAGRRLPVTFDFDNTLVCGDIGEATLALLVRSGLKRLLTRFS